MAARTSPFSPGRLARTALAGVLLAGAAVVGVVHPAQAAGPTADPTGFTGMMPPDSPDAVATSSGARLGGTVQTAGTQPTGVDVSHWQHDAGPLDWSRVAASGQKFAVIKATDFYTDSNGQPAVFTDPYLHSDLNAAHAAGLVVGAYAFARPQYSPIAQADAFADAIGNLPAGSLPPVLDLEKTGGLSPAQLVSWAHAFLDRLQARTNIVPMIYSSPLWWRSATGDSTEFSRYPLWEAHYTSAAEPYQMGGWSTYTLWQYSSSGTVPGITGAVDLDRSNGQSLTSIAEVAVPRAIRAPASLLPGQSLKSANRQYQLVMQGDGNLVEYSNGRALWSTQTSRNSRAVFRLQSDGNMVIYSSSGRALWSSRTAGRGSGGLLTLQDDGGLVLRVGGQWAWSNGAPGSDRLYAPAVLQADQYLHTPAGTALLRMQSDGNLVLYRYGRALWATATNRWPGARLILQMDGNLVIYDGYGTPRWSSRTNGRGGNRLVMQADGNLVLYGPRGAVWATGTNR